MPSSRFLVPVRRRSWHALVILWNFGLTEGRGNFPSYATTGLFSSISWKYAAYEWSDSMPTAVGSTEMLFR